MSPFFRGSVRPPRRHPRPWSMNPRLNPDVVMDGTSEKDHMTAQTAEIGLPVTNSIYGKPGEFTGRHTTDGGDPAAAAAIAAPETNGGTTSTTADIDVSKPAEPNTFDPGDEVAAVTETTQPGQSLLRSVTRDSGTAMMESPYLNDFVEKDGSNGPSSPEETLDVPPDTGHARADSSTIGAAGTVEITGPVPDAQAVETDEEEKGGDADGEIALVDGLAAEDAEPHSSVDGTPALGEPLMDDAQLDVSDEFRPGTAVRDGEPREPQEAQEPLISDEQLEVSDEFRPQTNMQGPM